MSRKKKDVARGPAAADASAARKLPLPLGVPYAVVLVLATLAAYSNSFSSGFALDNHAILEDTRLQTASAENVGLILDHSYWWPNGESGLYRPLTTLSYLFNYAILGNRDHPAGYHAINLLLHAANVLLMFALMLRLSRRPRVAFVIALVWALHPVLTESVTNIVGRADLLEGFAVLGGFLLYFESTETVGTRRAALLLALAMVAAIGVFSKESAVVLPGVIIFYELCRGRWRRALPACALTLVPIAMMLWQRSAVLSRALPAEYPFVDNPITGADFWVGRLTAVEVLARYLGLWLWPVKLSADYSYAQVPLFHGAFEDWIWLTVAGAAAGVAAMLWKRDRLAFFFVGFAFLNLLPASNLFFPIGTIMAERLLYLPAAGLIAAAILAIGRFHLPPPAVVLCAALVAALFGVRTRMRNIDWTSDRTMAVAGVEASPRSFKFHRLLAATLVSSDPAHPELDRALAEADHAVAILSPLPDERDLPAPWNLDAVCHRLKGDTLSGATARAQYQDAARLALRSITIDTVTRAAYGRRHNIPSPVPPSAAAAYRTLASVYLDLRFAPEALAAASEAQKIDPSEILAYEEMADAYVAEGRAEEAAITIAQGGFSTGRQSVYGDLVKIYQSGLDGQGCAIVNSPRGTSINPNCAMVHHDLCEAALRANRADLRGRMGCSN